MGLALKRKEYSPYSLYLRGRLFVLVIAELENDCNCCMMHLGGFWLGDGIVSELGLKVAACGPVSD